MEIAVLADIHSNYIALDRCMEHALSRGIHEFIFLGDYVGEMAYPERTMARIYEYAKEYRCTFIRGNKEDYWINYRAAGASGWREYDSTTGALWYAYHQLTDRDIDFFQSLPITRRLEYENLPSITICHGSPLNVRERMYADGENTRKSLEQVGTELMLCAHTHVQAKTVFQGKTALNPGSVGLSLEAGALSQYLILHGEYPSGKGIWREEFVTLDYDREMVIRQLSESGLTRHSPNWCKITEHDLRNPERELGHGNVLNRVMELCREESGEWCWPDIPEKYWDLAMKEFGL